VGATEDRGLFNALDMLDPDLLIKVYEATLPEEAKEDKEKARRTSRTAMVKRIVDTACSIGKEITSWLATLDSGIVNAIAAGLEIK
jgi:hypothetical protein